MHASLFSSFLTLALSPLWRGERRLMHADGCIIPACAPTMLYCRSAWRLWICAVGRHRPLLCAYALLKCDIVFLKTSQLQLTHTPPSSNGNGFLLCAQGEMLIRGSAGGTNVLRTQNQGHKSLDPFECGPGLTILLCARSGCNFAALRYHGSAQHIKCALTSQSIKLKC